jgi:hypothetical protein
MDSHPHGQSHPLLLCQAAIERRHGLHHAEPGPHCPLRIVLMGAWVAKVDEQAIAEILRYVPVKALDDLGGGLLIGAHHLAQVFGVELLAQTGGVNQVAEQDR